MRPPWSRGTRPPDFTQITFKRAAPSPANSFVFRGTLVATRTVQMNQVEYELIRTQPGGKFLLVGSFRSHHVDHILLLHFARVIAKERTDMIDVAADDLPVGTNQAAQRYCPVPDFGLARSAQEAFNQPHQGTFAQVVRSGLRAQAQQAVL